MPSAGRSWTGYAALAGGLLGLLLAPVMVIVKYMTGWAVIPEPGWVEPARAALGTMLGFGPPPLLWTAYGSAYTVALVLMLVGLVGMSPHLRDGRCRIQTSAYWAIVGGLCLVIPGDAVHTWTWHQHGLTTPTPGTNPLANTAYAVHMMGMNVVMLGSLMLGVSALRRKRVTRWLAWGFTLMLPAAVLASVTVLPTTPSGALWLFSAVMIGCGYLLATGGARRLEAA